MEHVYRIAKWSEIFETADSRRHKALHWISVPIGFESNGFAKMIEDFGDEAPAMYGAWIALAKIAATCPIRGILSTSRGDGLTVGRLSFLSHFPRSSFEKLIDWASQKSVNWLEKLDVSEVKQLLIDSDSIDNRLPNELPDQTRPNPTLPRPDQTRPEPTGGQSVGRRLDLDGVDREQAKRLARDIKYKVPFDLPEELLGRIALVSLAAGTRSEIIEAAKECKAKRSPDRWFLAAVSGAAIEAGFDAQDVASRLGVSAKRRAQRVG